MLAGFVGGEGSVGGGGGGGGGTYKQEKSTRLYDMCYTDFYWISFRISVTLSCV